MIDTSSADSNLRKATLKGHWYEEDNEVLLKQLNEFLDKAETVKVPELRGVVVPHAGIKYSGEVAAYSYKNIDPSKYKRLFLLGQFHFDLSLKGAFLPMYSAVETSFGNIKVDSEVVKDLIETGHFKTMTNEKCEAENSLELQFPYIGKLFQLDYVTVIPIMMGKSDITIDSNIGKSLVKYYEDKENLFILSTDWCHWGGHHQYFAYDKNYKTIHEYITALDRKALDLVEANDIEGFEQYLEETKNTICGARAVTVVMHTLRNASFKSTVKFLKYDMWNREINTFDEETVAYGSALISISD